VNGNTSTCTTTVTVEDNIAPVATCLGTTLYLDNNGLGSTTASAMNNGSSDNCGIQSMTLNRTNFDCSNVFTLNIITLTVTDVNGNSSTCSGLLTVVDSIPPVALCQNVTVVLDSNGVGSTTASAMDNGSTDACGIQALALSNNSFTCANLGSNPVILTVTDASGNTSTCTGTVTVDDSIAPVALCQNITLQLDNTGNGNVSASAVDNGSTDNCVIASLALSQTAFDCGDVGSNGVVLTVTDANGNSNTCSATVMVEDTVAPIAICQNLTLQLDVTGNASTTASAIDNGSSDACGIGNMSLSQSAFVCSEVGANTEVLTVTDVNGNSTTCTTTITVEDNVAPNAVCQNITVQLDNTGNASITAAQFDNGSSDACGIASLALDITTFNCANVSGNTVTLTVTDVNGNSSTCMATVTIEDLVAPNAICQNVTVQLDNTGNGSTTASAVDNGSTDNCAIASLSLSQTAFTCSEVGANTEVLTVTDVNGNTSTCTTTITVEDNVAPVAICQDVTVQLDNTGNGATTASAVDNGSTDACGIQSLVLSQSAFVCSEVGVNTEVLTVTDVNGNSTTCTTTITVEDNVAPNAVCQNITVQLDNTGNASITAAQVDNGSTDACGIASLALDITTFNCANVSGNTVTLTVTDVNGNSSTCTATVTIEDLVTPNAICQNVTVQLDNTGNGSTTASAVDNGSTDNCAIASLSLSQTAFVCSEVGANTEILTVTDVNGNTSTCTATITVEDNVAPVAICQDVTVQLDNTGNCATTASAVDNGSTDACGIQSLVLSQSAFVCSEVGLNTEVLTVTDVNGNSTTCTTTITVEDNVAPNAICQNITVQLDNTGNASITTGQIDNGSADACGIASLALDITTFNCANVSGNTVTLTVTDVNGNSSTCTATIAVADTVAPVAICQNATVQLDNNGSGSILASTIDNGSNDACGIASLTVSMSTFGCVNVGTNAVTLMATDFNGNTSTCTATVTVQDTVDPIANCQNITVQLNNSGVGTTTASAVNNASSDACGIQSLSLTQTTFGCAEVGANTEVLTVTDVNGNSSTCTTTITVQDTVPPTAICRNATVQLNLAGIGIIAPASINNGSNDACGLQLLSFSLSQNSFGCTDVGINTEVLTVVDVNGNSGSCTTLITVEDNVAPVANCQNVTVQLDANGNGSITAAAVNNGSTDACGIASLSLSMSTFNCNNVGANTVNMIVTDVNGNTSICSATVTVEDTVAPVAVCQAATVFLNANGTGNLTPADVDHGSGDACSISSFALSNSTFSCVDLGNDVVVLTVTDVNGNSDTCWAAITIRDTVLPTVVCPANISLAADSSLCGAVATWVAPVGTDNCSGTVTVGSHVSGTTFPDGITVVTYTATDSSGNSMNCSFTVTVTPDPLQVTASSVLQGCGFNLRCATDVNGFANSYVAGGCMPYQYAWSTGDTSANITGLAAGTYFVTVTDARNQVAVDTIVITAPAPLVVAIVGDTLVCQGATTGDLQAVVTGGQSCAAYSYLWSTGSFVSTVTNLSAGTYTVTVIDSLGCVANASATLQLGVNPVLDLGPDTVSCPGIPLLFSAPTTYSAYLWSNGSVSPTIMMNNPGMYTCTVWTAEGCQDMDTVMLGTHVVDYNIITPLSPLSVCTGDTVTLQGDAGLTGYLWNTGQTTQTITVATTGGPIILSAFDGNGCATRDTVNVTIIPFNDPLPVIFPGPNAFICDSGSVVLDAGLGYFSYLWSNGATTQTISVNQGGTYHVTVWNGFGCSATSTNVTVTMASSPNPTIVLNSGILTTTQPYAGYQWYVNGFQLPGANSQTFPVSVAGWYHVGVVDSTGCTGLSDSIYYSPVGVAETFEDLTGITLYPNPSMGIVNLRTLSPIDWPIEIEIWDVVGQKVKVYNMAHLMDVAAFDLNDLAAGPYLMKITTFRRNKTHQAVIRFVLQ
ncbi:MAG TPA: HYR domain-containing protein, partial [Bacteroidia bacterium]|nr:HYR domain-containing protein [Bacteroidia bacterium]